MKMTTFSFPAVPVVAALLLASGLAGCRSAGDRKVAKTAGPARHYVPDDEGVPAIARREIIRRQERMQAADQAALRASQMSVEGDYQGAIEGYRRALTTLPATE